MRYWKRNAMILMALLISSGSAVAQTNVDANGRIKISSDGKITMSSNGVHPTTIPQAAKDEYDLFVRNGVISKEFGIYPDNLWPDYVFKKDYPLMELRDLRTFIKKNEHLPGVLSQKEVATNGYQLHKMNVALLEKVEELTLYILLLEDRISRLEKDEKKQSEGEK